LPDSASPEVLARVAFEPHQPSAEDRERAASIRTRHTDRRPGSSWPIPEARLDQACHLASTRGVLAVALSPEENRITLLELMNDAARVQLNDRRNAFELETRHQTRRPIDVTDTDAAWLILSTSSDDALSWLRTGEALQVLWLWAAGHGLALVPHSQVLEVPLTRQRLQTELINGTSCPQLVVRLGWATAEPEQAITTDRDTARVSAGGEVEEA
jgi:hypothetical protein